MWKLINTLILSSVVIVWLISITGLASVVYIVIFLIFSNFNTVIAEFISTFFVVYLTILFSRKILADITSCLYFLEKYLQSKEQ